MYGIVRQLLEVFYSEAIVRILNLCKIYPNFFIKIFSSKLQIKKLIFLNIIIFDLNSFYNAAVVNKEYSYLLNM